MENYFIGTSNSLDDKEHCKCKKINFNTQFSETDKLYIPKNKPNIKEVLEFCMNVSICSFKIINTSIGRKLVVEGTKHIKILYTADKPCQSVHSAHFNMPFCTFIILKQQDITITNIKSCIEYASLLQLDKCCFCISSIIGVTAQGKLKHYNSHPYENICGYKNHIDPCNPDRVVHTNKHDCHNFEHNYTFEKYCESPCTSHGSFKDKNLNKSKIDCKYENHNCSDCSYVSKCNIYRYNYSTKD